jgi:uncharacterized protein (DUF2252 family)
VGKAARARVPRPLHAEWAAADVRPDPLRLLEDQATRRVPELVPIRYGRMAASPFSFYRGAANVLAADLAGCPRTGLEVQLCGDAHLSNFGGFATPERSLIFDVNDFDETLPGPFEWDVKRLAASLEIAGRARGFGRKERARTVSGAVRAYREAMRAFARMSNLDIWYSRLSVESLLQRWGRDAGRRLVAHFRDTLEQAGSKNRLEAKAKLTHVVGGELRFRSMPPLLVPAEEVVGRDHAKHFVGRVHDALRSYRRTLAGNRRHLLEGYRFVDLARKVVGVGSVGTRCWVALLVGRDNDDPLFIQVKEAEASVLEPHLGRSGFDSHGQRVVEGQRLMQAASDIFLGWDVATGADGVTRDFYCRQLWDAKASAEVESMEPATLELYGQMCGWTLARAHARSGDCIAIGAYLGSGPAFDRALTAFAHAYAEQNDLDHRALVEAIERGEIVARAE